MSEGEPDGADDRPRPLLSAGFWAFLVFAFLCVVAGAAIVLLGPKLWPPAAEPAAPPASGRPA